MREKPLTEFMGRAKKKEKKPAPKASGLKGPWELPEGWKWVRLGEVVTRRVESIDPAQSNLPFVGLEHITPGELRLSQYSTETDLKSQKSVFYPGDILYGKLRPYLDKAVVATIKGMCSTDLLVLTPKKGAIPEYLVLFMHTHYFLNLATEYMRGTNHPRISWKSLQKFLIPLPPLEEQKRIVAKLDEVSKRLEEAKRLAREAREQAERLMASALHEVFSKAEERGWEWVRLGDAVTRRNETIDPVQNHNLPFVGLEHIMPGEVKLSRYSSTVDLKSQKYVFYPRDVLYGKLRPYLDKAVVATIKGMCSTDLLVLTPKEGLMPEYLVTFMHTPQFRELATQYMRGTNHPRISWKSLQKFKIPLPPLEEQKRIVAYLDRISERAQKLVKLYEEREKELEQLFPAVLDRAFRGELV